MGRHGARPCRGRRLPRPAIRPDLVLLGHELAPDTPATVASRGAVTAYPLRPLLDEALTG